jgi:hypothetical protein
MCAVGYTPVTYDLVVSLGLRIPTVPESDSFFAWYRSLATTGDTNYIRTGQKRRGGCLPDSHGDLYIYFFNQFGSGSSWPDLFTGGGSCNLPTGSANNMSHPLAGVLCARGVAVLPHM